MATFQPSTTGVATAAGIPQLSNDYIPPIYTSTWLIEFYARTVIGAIANTNWEGEVKEQGDKVIIRATGDITIVDHEKGQELNYETPDPTPTEFNVDKGLAWAFAANLIDERQSDMPFVQRWSAHAAEKMKIKCDTNILADVFTDAHAKNKGTTAGAISGDINLGATSSPIALTKSNIIDHIVNMGTVLDEQNVPEEDRWIVLPARFVAMIKQSDLKDASLSGDAVSIARNGRVGMVDRFNIYLSNLLNKVAADSAYDCMFGHPEGLTFAAQIIHQESLMNPKTFGKIYRGLKVYGYKGVKPEALGHFYAKVG
jgi:hypothetical protein